MIRGAHAQRFQHPEVVLITGATGGIGSALAGVYAGPQRSLILHGRNEQKLDELAQLCSERGARVQTEVQDLRKVGEWKDRLESLASRVAIDLAIVNAGVTGHIGASGEGESWAGVEDIIDVNLRAAVATVHAVLPSMRRRGAGQLALIGSLSAYYGLPVTPAYCASKAALKAYGESLRAWLGPEGVAVNVVLPGFVETAMSARFPGPKVFVLRPETAAGKIQQGLVRNKARISFPVPLSWGMWWLAVLPPEISERILRALNYAGAPGKQRKTR